MQHQRNNHILDGACAFLHLSEAIRRNCVPLHLSVLRFANFGKDIGCVLLGISGLPEDCDQAYLWREHAIELGLVESLAHSEDISCRVR